MPFNPDSLAVGSALLGLDQLCVLVQESARGLGGKADQQLNYALVALGRFLVFLTIILQNRCIERVSVGHFGLLQAFFEVFVRDVILPKRIFVLGLELLV